MAQETKFETIQAVDRALHILETLGRVNTMNLADLNREIKVNKASLSRLLYTLERNGYIVKNEKTNEFSLTMKTYEVGLNALQNIDRLSLINSTLVDLNSQTGRIAQFSVEDNNQLLCLQSVGKESLSFSVYTSVGYRSPLYSTSAGKALLSTYPNGTIIEKWEQMNIQPLTEHTLTDIQSFLQDMGLTRQRGYALDIEENEYHVFCVGSVIMDYTNKPIGSISISGSSLTKEEENNISKILMDSCKKLSGLLGYAR